MSDQVNPVQNWITERFLREMALREMRMHALIKPKPRWLPQFVWRRVLARTLNLIEFNAAGIAPVYPWAPGTGEGDTE